MAWFCWLNYSNEKEINNAAFIICEIFSKYNVMNGSNEILSKLLDQTTIDKFFEHLKSDVIIFDCW